MRIQWSQYLLLAAFFGIPERGLAAPCVAGKRLTGILKARGPEPGPPASPKPVTPRPRPQHGVPVCRRTPGGDCQVTPFPKNRDEQVRQKGAESQANLESKQAVQHPVDEPADPVSKNYDTKTNDEVPLLANSDDVTWLNHQIPDINFDSAGPWKETIVRNKGELDKQNAQDILKTYQNPKAQTMVISKSNNKEVDKLAGKPEQLRWSDMVMENWVESSKAAGKDPSELKYMIRDVITTDETQDAIEAALKRNKGNGYRMQEYRSDPKVASEDELAAYQLIAGTVHGDRVLKMLADHPETMKNVRIESFSVFTPYTHPGSGEYEIVIKFYKAHG